MLVIIFLFMVEGIFQAFFYQNLETFKVLVIRPEYSISQNDKF